jgi:hypothetical protein
MDERLQKAMNEAAGDCTVLGLKASRALQIAATMCEALAEHYEKTEPSATKTISVLRDAQTECELAEMDIHD